MAVAGDQTPPPSYKWVPGAEPIGLCMNCDSTYPAETTECPKCRLALSTVRKCPECQRIQSAQHFRCIYCSATFVGSISSQQVPLPEPAAAEPRLSPRVLAALAVVIVLGVVTTYLVLDHVRKMHEPKPPIGQSYVLRAGSLRQEPSLNAAVIKNLNAPEIVDISDFAIDATGQRWFDVTILGVRGYVLAEELAAPKGKTAESGFLLLRFSLLALNDPAALPEASQAVAYYQAAFPESLHRDEVVWLLAERNRQLAARSSQPQVLLRRARELYESIAAGSGQLAGEARQALAQLPRTLPNSAQPDSSSSALDFSVVGGSLSSPSGDSGSGSAPVRNITVLEQTVLPVVLTEPVLLTAGVVIQAKIAQDIRVNQQIAIPRGSICYLSVEEEGAVAKTRVSPSVILHLDALVVDHRTYPVSAGEMRVLPSSPSNTTDPQLEAGTRISFRLKSHMVISRS